MNFTERSIPVKDQWPKPNNIESMQIWITQFLLGIWYAYENYVANV